MHFSNMLEGQYTRQASRRHQMQQHQNVPSPSDYSWVKGESRQWQPVWTTIPKVSAVCRELIKCACKKRCLRCKCAREQLKCTPLCNF